MKQSDKNTALVVLSGGQDSITCLGLALSLYDSVHAIAFNYGQRQAIELECAQTVASRYGVPLRLVDLPLAGLVQSALTGPGDVSAPHIHKPGLPASFVPARNALFLTLAHGYAQTIDAGTILTGVCETDFSGYPDCRAVFIRALEATLNIGYESDITFRTPLMHIDKAGTFALADRVGFLATVIGDSHTCYEGDHRTSHKWGFGCGECPACLLRAAGWAKYLKGDFNSSLVHLATIR